VGRVSIQHQAPTPALAILLGGDAGGGVEEGLWPRLIIILSVLPPLHRWRGNERKAIDWWPVMSYINSETKESVSNFCEQRLDYMISKEMKPVQIDVINTKVIHMINRVPIEVRSYY